MAWTYEAWPSQSTAVARRDMLALHLGEVSEAMGTGGHLGAAGRFRDPRVLREYYDSLLAQIRIERTDAAAEEAADAQVLRTFGIQFAGVGGANTDA